MSKELILALKDDGKGSV